MTDQSQTEKAGCCMPAGRDSGEGPQLTPAAPRPPEESPTPASPPDARIADARVAHARPGSPLAKGSGYRPGTALTQTAETIPFADAGDVTGMVKLPGGSFLMGTDSPEAWADDGEGPIREVSVTGLYVAETAVTNAQFKAFADATGYKTESEQFGWSYVFRGHLDKAALAKFGNRNPGKLTWWVGVPEACWKRPFGPKSDLRSMEDHPVVHVSWNDAVAYCRWAGVRLPFEAEWEYAARGGLVQAIYPWGDELTPDGKHRCNIWQGRFPHKNTAEDGYAGTCPVKSFEPNGHGLWCVSGNAWEWCADWFSPTFHQQPGASRENPRGPGEGNVKAMRGGSYLCHASYCNRYRVAARTANTPDSGSSNCGFRVVRDL